MKRLLVLLGGVAIAFGVACKDNLGNGNGCASTGANSVITVDNGTAYSNPSITVSPGARICWENTGGTAHSVTSEVVVDSVVDDSTWHLDGQLNPELVVLYSKFNKVGADYRYYCRYHQAQGMTGVIHVR